MTAVDMAVKLILGIATVELKIVLLTDIFEYDLNWPKLNSFSGVSTGLCMKHMGGQDSGSCKDFNGFSFDAKREVKS